MFEQYGGLAFLSRVVLNFYDRVLASVRLAPFFADVDMQRLVALHSRQLQHSPFRLRPATEC